MLIEEQQRIQRVEREREREGERERKRERVGAHYLQGNKNSWGILFFTSTDDDATS